MTFSKGESKQEFVDEETLQKFRKAAEQGDADAQFNLGVIYTEGKGVVQHYQEALKWYQKAAEQGHVDAQFEMGEIYEDGRGVAREFVQAHTWFNLAAAGGNEKAIQSRNIIGKIIEAEQLAEAQKLAWEFKPRSNDAPPNHGSMESCSGISKPDKQE